MSDKQSFLVNGNERIKYKYPFMPTSIIRLKRHRVAQDLRKDRYYKKQYGNFDLDICEFILKYYNREKGTILDPFAGWGERGLVAKEQGYVYIGYDISQDAIEYAFNHYNIQNTKADSRCLPIEDNTLDFCISCPPYWRLEKYASCEGQLTDIYNYNLFLIELKKVISETYRVLKEGSLCAWVVGDFRIEGKFYDFSTDVINLFKDSNFKVFDKVIIDKSINFNIAIYLKTVDKGGFTVKLHEYIMVFKK